MPFIATVGNENGFVAKSIYCNKFGFIATIFVVAIHQNPCSVLPALILGLITFNGSTTAAKLR
jgi:hypothetical protein